MTILILALVLVAKSSPDAVWLLRIPGLPPALSWLVLRCPMVKAICSRPLLLSCLVAGSLQEGCNGHPLLGYGFSHRLRKAMAGQHCSHILMTR